LGKVKVAATVRRLGDVVGTDEGIGHHMDVAETPLALRVRHGLGSLARRVGLRRIQAGPEQPSDPGYGPKPEVVVERTNVGPAFDELVARARRNQRRYGVNPDYDLLREHFDHYHYMLQATALHEDPEADPIRMFLRAGAKASISPDVNFSMQKYLSRHPERAHGPERSPYLEWIKRGKLAGEIADPADGIEALAPQLGLEPGQVADELARMRTDMAQRLRTGTLGEMFAKAVELEPLIGEAWIETTRMRMVPIHGKFVSGAVAAVHACQQAADFTRARLVIVTNRPRWGGGRRLEGHLAHALSGTVGADSIVVVYTDRDGTAPPGRFPPGVREVDFAGVTQSLPDEHKQQALAVLLRSFRADAIVNINSRVLYAAMAHYGKALAASERIFLCFFVHERRAQGNRFGMPLQFFYPYFDLVEGVITDSDYLRDDLTEMYQLSKADRERIHVFRAPVEPELPVAVPPSSESAPRRPLVYWAGRWDRQKRVDIALDVTRRMPDVDFRFWGEAVFRGAPIGEVPANVTFEGRYDHIAELDLSPVDAWLYTSEWDGVPSLLLEVAMTEVPVVASDVGGVGEVLSPEDAWPVADWENPEAYEKALREIFSDPQAARQRSRALRRRLEGERTQSAYGDHAAQVLLGRDRTGAAR
jgi:glycosyltransferase involved in cell wall biosynthesis